MAGALHAPPHLLGDADTTLSTMILGRQATTSTTTRWVQLGLGLVCMMTISSPQYVWALFTTPMATAFGVQAAALQVTITILIVLQTFFSPFQGYLVQRFGPALLIGLGAALTGLSWVLASFATSLTALYLSYGVVGGLGTGIVYVGVVGQVMGWFPHRRGFAAGIVAAGYGMGAILTTFPIADKLAAAGYPAALLEFGFIFGIIGVLAALGLRRPPATVEPGSQAADGPAGARDTPTRVMLRHPVFWLMFVMMSLMSTTGLMVTTQIGFFASDFGIKGATVAMTVWLTTRTDPVAFVLLSGLVFFGWGEIFSLFPSTLTDTFGSRYATTNYGCLYIAQGVGSILGGPMASLLHGYTGNWASVFGVAIAADVVTALLAIAVLKPLRRRMAEPAVG